ncbi:unnamed protein product [Closterium sp. NIES-53]
MASLRVLAFDHEGRPVKFDTWLENLQPYLLSDIKESVSLFHHVPVPLLPLPPQLTVRLAHTAETSAVAVGAACGTPRSPFFEGCSPSPLAPSYTSAAAADVSVAYDVRAASASAKCRSSKGKSGKGGGGGSGGGGGGSGGSGGGSSGGGSGGGIGGGSGGSGGGGGGSGGSGGSGGGGTGGGGTGARRVGSGGGQRQQQQRRSKTQSPQQLREWFLQRGASGGSGSCPYVIRTGDSAGQTCGRLHTQHQSFSRLDDASRAVFGDDAELPRWADLLRSRIATFDLDFDAILSAMYALSVSAEGDCYRCVPPDPGIAAAALGASESGTLTGTAPAQALHTFTLDSGASACFFRDRTALTPLSAPVPVRLADPSGGALVARSSTVLLCPAVPSGSLSSLHLPSFSTNLVSTAALQDAMVTTTTPGGRRVSICTCTRTGRHLATFTRRPGSSLYTLATEPPRVAASAQVSASGQVAASCSCRLLSHQTLLWHHRLGHPSLPRLRGMHSRLLRAAPHSSSFPPTIAPLQTLHMDVWGPARVSGQSHERYFLLVVDDYTRYMTVFPLRSNSEVFDVLIPWIRTDFCRGEGILQSFTLPNSPQQNGIAERRISLVMEVARTSMIHAAAPHILWPFVVRYAAHELNLWPRVSLPETSPTLRWTGKVGDESVFWVWGSRAFVCDTSADVMFDESVPFYRLFPYHSAPPPPPPLFLAPGPPQVDPLPPQGPPQVDSLPPQGPAPSGVSQVDPLPGTVHVQVALGSGAACGDARSGGAEPGGAESEGAGSGGAEPEGVESGGVEPRDAESEGAESGGAEPRANGARGARAAGARGVGVTARAGGTGAGGTGAGGAGAARAGAVDRGAGGTVRPRPYFSQLPLQPASPLPAPSPYTETSGGLTDCREPVSHPVLPVRTACRVPRSRSPPVPSTHAMAVRPSSVPLHLPLPPPPESSLPEVPDPESERAHAASPTVARLLATAVTDPSFESAVASTLVAELLDFAAACRLDYATALVAESESANPPSVGGECALSTDVLEDRQEELECLAVAVPRFASMLLAPEADPDAPDIPTPRSYVEVITGPYSSQWETAMDAEMASWKSTGTYVDEVPPPGANIVDGMWIFRGVDYFQTFSPTPKMTTLRVLLHVAAHHDYELHSLDFNRAFLHGSLHEEIWLRCPPGFTGSTTLAALGCAPATADPSPFLRTDTSLPPFYVLVYISWDRARRTITLTHSHMVHQEHRLEHRMKHIALRYFLARELQQHGQLRLAYVATRSNTADIFTKALPPGDHQRFSTVLGIVPTLPHLPTA